MPERWLLRFGVHGDLRFLSHHDMARLMERTATRARLPLRYSRGFNPRPRLSLLCPRPVAVAALEDPLLLRTDQPVEPDAMRDALNAHAPRGLGFRRPAEAPAGQAPLPIRMHFVCPVADEAAVGERLQALRDRDSWPVERIASADRRGRTVRRTIDLRPLLAEIEVRQGQLRWQAIPMGDLWPRPGEVLRLVGLPECPALAEVVRTRVELSRTGERPTDNGETICRS